MIHNYIKKYKTIILSSIAIFLYIGLRYALIPNANPEKLINDFLAGLFLSFGILNINTFGKTKESIKKYDFFGKKFAWYCEFYPFIILFFGMALHVNSIPVIVSALAIVIFGGQLYEMTKIIKTKDKVSYVAFGTNSPLPVSKITVGINSLIIGLGLIMIILEII